MSPASLVASSSLRGSRGIGVRCGSLQPCGLVLLVKVRGDGRTLPLTDTPGTWDLILTAQVHVNRSAYTLSRAFQLVNRKSQTLDMK